MRVSQFQQVYTRILLKPNLPEAGSWRVVSDFLASFQVVSQ